MVRLKVDYNAFYNSVFTFQFLMVRLKDRMGNGSEASGDGISIPYGAIKR